MKYGKGHERKTIKRDVRLSIVEDMMIKMYATTHGMTCSEAVRELILSAIKANDRLSYLYETAKERIENGTFFEQPWGDEVNF